MDRIQRKRLEHIGESNRKKATSLIMQRAQKKGGAHDATEQGEKQRLSQWKKKGGGETIGPKEKLSRTIPKDLVKGGEGRTAFNDKRKKKIWLLGNVASLPGNPRLSGKTSFFREKKKKS